MKQRILDILVLSDLHLGTNQCRAGRLLKYLKSVKPEMLILNGDIIDIWLLDLKKWPKKHTKVMSYFFQLMIDGTPIYYLPGNHDDYLKQFAGFKFHNFFIENELVLEIDGKKNWFMHGDKYDKTISGRSRNLAIRAGKAYDAVVGFNRLINQWENFLGKKNTLNFTKVLKDKTKSRIKKSNDFEQVYIEEAAENEIDNLLCGHVHRPGITTLCSIKNEREVNYLNSGDWTENCTSLEYYNKNWHLYRYDFNYNHYESTLKNMNFNDEDINPFLFK